MLPTMIGWRLPARLLASVVVLAATTQSTRRGWRPSSSETTPSATSEDGSSFVRPPAVEATPCERRVIEAHVGASRLPVAEAEMAALEAAAVASMRNVSSESLEVFAHMPLTGGSAWSWRLAATYPVGEIAPGSGFSKPYGSKPDPWLACAGGSAWRVLFSHDGPGCAAAGGIKNFTAAGVVYHETTMLRGSLAEGRKRVIQRRFNVGVFEAMSGRKASTL